MGGGRGGGGPASSEIASAFEGASFSSRKELPLLIFQAICSNKASVRPLGAYTLLFCVFALA